MADNDRTWGTDRTETRRTWGPAGHGRVRESVGEEELYGSQCCLGIRCIDP